MEGKGSIAYVVSSAKYNVATIVYYNFLEKLNLCLLVSGESQHCPALFFLIPL